MNQATVQRRRACGRWLAAAALSLAAGNAAWGQHAWDVVFTSPTVTPHFGVSENFLMTGPPWDTDGTDNCPPAGPDDVRCEWLTQHTGANPQHLLNGVLAAVLQGTVNESAVFLSDVWADALSSGSTWWVNYDVHFVAMTPADLPNLRVTTLFQHAGITQLTLNLSGQTSLGHVEFVVAPTHVWFEIPETGASWRIRTTLRRIAAGQPAMIWVDNVHVTEAATVHFDDVFPLRQGDIDGDGTVGIIDLLGLLASWGPCPQPCPPACSADVNGDCTVGILDFLALLGNWG